jgi:hypothetical protein
MTHSLMNNFAKLTSLSSLDLLISPFTLHAVLSCPSLPTNKRRSLFLMSNIILEMILTYSNSELMAYIGDAFYKKKHNPSLFTIIPFCMAVMLQQPKLIQKCFNLSSFGRPYSRMQEHTWCHVTSVGARKTL